MEEFSTANVVVLEETAQWRSRFVTYCTGDWNEILTALPEFDLTPFKTGDGAPSNPFLQTVIRLPRWSGEHPIPIGIVSKTYALAPHREVAGLCLDGLLDVGIDPDDLRYELGLSELGEWMNLRIYFPNTLGFVESQGRKLDLRLECFNSVDGSCRLVIFFGWFRLVCSNGLVIGETKIEIKERHGLGLDLHTIRQRLHPAFEAVEADRKRMKAWQEGKVGIEDLATWANEEVTNRWGKKAAARVFHICRTGLDVEIDTFVTGPATQKPIRYVKGPVPGSPVRATTKYDVSQSLSFVATHRNNAEERVKWQADIPMLLDRIPTSRSPKLV